MIWAGFSFSEPPSAKGWNRHSVVAWISWFTEILNLSQPVVCWEVVHTHFSRAGSSVALVCVIYQFPLENICLSWPIWRSPHKAFRHSVFRDRRGSKHPHPEIIRKPLAASPFMQTLKTQMEVRDTQTCHPTHTPVVNGDLEILTHCPLHPSPL